MVLLEPSLGHLERVHGVHEGVLEVLGQPVRHQRERRVRLHVERLHVQVEVPAHQDGHVPVVLAQLAKELDEVLALSETKRNNS